MKNARRAQAALEYLFTYGWAFMAILITIGALAYFGVFDFNNLRPSECLFSPGVTCEDHTITNDPLVRCGDINMDGVIGPADQTLMSSGGPFTAEQLIIGDLSGDGAVTGVDAGMVVTGYGTDGSSFAVHPCSVPVVRAQLRNTFGADIDVFAMNATDSRGVFVSCENANGPALASGVFSWDRDSLLNLSCVFAPGYYAQDAGYDVTVTINFTQRGETYEHHILGGIVDSAQ